jgi:hypothetical protein
MVSSYSLEMGGRRSEVPVVEETCSQKDECRDG